MIPRYSRAEMSRIWSEENSFDLWLQVEIAAAEAWTEQGIIPPEDMEVIRTARFNMERYEHYMEQTQHDLISFTRAVSETVGSSGRWIHYGLTSNDIKDTALSLQMVASVDLVSAGVLKLMAALKKRALQFKFTPCIGRSHGIHAEPMSFGLKFALWWSECDRHMERLASLRKRVAACMISGPVGTFAGIPPMIEESVAKRLSLTPAAISNQVLQRDRHAEYVQTFALIAATLEKAATEIRSLQRTEISEVAEPFGAPGYVTKGSSSMPHKRNPEICERICGLSRLIRGHSITALENVALWHERDISHSSAERVILPDASMALDYMLERFTGVIDLLDVYPERIMQNLEMTRGLVFSPRVMSALISAGMERAQAYDVVQRCALLSWNEQLTLLELLSSDREVVKYISKQNLEKLFDYSWHLRFVDRQFQRLGWDDTQNG